MSSADRRGGWDDRAPEAPGRSGAIVRIGGSISGPALVVVGLLVAALAFPLLDQPPSSVLSRIELPRGSIIADLAFSPDGDRVYTDHKGLGPTVLGIDERGLYRGRSLEEVSCARLAVDPTGRALVLALSDNTIRVLDPETLDLRHAMIGHESRIMDLRISEDGETLVSVDSDGLVRIWTIAEGRLDREFRSPVRLSSCALSPDGDRLALGGQDGSVTVIDVATGRRIVAGDGHGTGGIVMDMRFAPDGRTLVSLGLDCCLRLWDTGDALAPTRTISLAGGISPCLAIAPDGRTIATGHHDGRVRLWDATTGEQVGERRVDSVNASSLCYDPAGRRLAVASGSSVTLLDMTESA